MLRYILRWLNIHEKEIGLFFWSVALLFLVRGAGVILNNYAETAFLKRFGVEFLPIVNMLNAVATVLVMGIVFGLIGRFPGPRLLAGQFLFCGASIIAIRLLIPMAIGLIYPLLFMLKVQYEALLAMLFWNLANDLFNTRQSKRLFPLITAGGVSGQILASFGTPLMARAFQFDNLLIVYLLITLTGTGVVWAMGRRYPSLLMDERGETPQKKRTSMIQEVRTVLPMLKDSVLMRLMVVLTFMPNVVIPILNYQFNYAVDMNFASESSMIAFFGYFRGALNLVSLIILLFVGKVYGRWGLPVALMFHPFNYVIAFTAFLLRFDVIAAMYARMSTYILRTTVNVPANAMMMGLFPESYRAFVRPFLRGTVVRIALFLGSGLILVSDTLFHPRYLSLVALPFVVTWLSVPFILKKKYAGILIDLLQQNQLDLQSLQPSEIEHIFHGQGVQDQLLKAFMASAPAGVLWHAELLQQLRYPDLDVHLMQRIQDLTAADQTALLQLLSDDPPAAVIDQLSKIAGRGDNAVALAVLQAVNRRSGDTGGPFDFRPYLDCTTPEIKAQAAAGLYRTAPEIYGPGIMAWIESDDVDLQKTGILAAGATEDRHFEAILKMTISRSRSPDLLAAALKSLHALGLHDLNDVATPFLTHNDKKVRLSALSAYHITDKESLKRAIPGLADEDPQIRQAVEDRILRAHYVDGKALIKALNHPNRDLRECVFDILEKLKIKGLDLYRLARDQLEGAYKYLNESIGIAALPESKARDLLMDHLNQQRSAIVQMVLRVLAVQDQSGRIQVIRRGLMSGDRRQRANSQEALDDVLDHRLSRVLIPLLEDDADDDAINIGRRRYALSNYRNDPVALLDHLLKRHDDWLSVLMTLFALEALPAVQIDLRNLHRLRNSPNIHIQRMARRVLMQRENPPSKEVDDMDTALTLPDIILKLKTVEIFEGLNINELAAVASVTEEVFFDSMDTVIREGDAGDTLFLILEGAVEVIKSGDKGAEVTLDHIGAGDYFGEMALFEEIPRTATVRTTQPCRMLILHKQEFNEMVREYPSIALKLCRVFSGRIRRLHQRIADG
jgi:ATP/ADP translocase